MQRFPRESKASFGAEAESLPDDVVVGQVLAGNVQAFEVLIRRYNQRLYRLARGILSDDQDAREAVQESYVKAYLSLDGFRGPGGFATWLYVITRNQAFSMLRHRQREVPMEMPTMENILDDTSLLDVPDPEEALESERLGKTLQHAIDRLPDAFRIVFVMRMVQGMSVRETAEILDLNEKTVKTRLFRARRMLRERFKGYLQGASAHVYEFAGRRCDALTAAVMARIAALGAGSMETRK
ncbi:MAG: RNA polymerase subunit sigma [Gammaproteobacteria bacterium]|nr:RNA polymerase subunit sigma [Gammaproteobacteria bacterium]